MASAKIHNHMMQRRDIGRGGGIDDHDTRISSSDTLVGNIHHLVVRSSIDCSRPEILEIIIDYNMWE